MFNTNITTINGANGAPAANIGGKTTKQCKEKSRKSPSQAEFDDMEASRDAFVSKFAEANHKRGVLETQLHNTKLQWQFEREGKDGRIAELTAALEAANARIAELEAADAKIAESQNL